MNQLNWMTGLWLAEHLKKDYPDIQKQIYENEKRGEKERREAKELD